MILTVAVYVNEKTNFRGLDLSTALLRKTVTFDTSIPIAGAWDKIYRIRELVFEQLNIDDPGQEWARRYREAGNRSLSVGDVVIVGQHIWAVAPVGWDPLLPHELIPIVPPDQRLWWMIPLAEGGHT